MIIRGARELHARLRAIERARRPITRTWSTETAGAMRQMVPVRTGALRRSIHPGRVTEQDGAVLANSSAFFVDKGTKPHDITPRKADALVFKGRNGTVFARKVHHRGSRARPFRVRAAREGLRRTHMDDLIVKAWNGAA